MNRKKEQKIGNVNYFGYSDYLLFNAYFLFLYHHKLYAFN
ncbi:hypothetical protein D083_2341 [Dickeya solani RNS 08.23.3.1.A]|nr:hypothetical protein D083_2341 [Dickeya solani RNS 08.23.3.1.A]